MSENSFSPNRGSASNASDLFQNELAGVERDSVDPRESMIGRVVRVLDSFDRQITALSLTELSKRTQLPMPTTHRIVTEMVKHGLLDRDEDLLIRMGLRLWELTSRSSEVLMLRQKALPHMERLQRLSGEVVALAILEDDSALYIEQLSGQAANANGARTAERHKLTESSTGLVLAAHGSAQTQQRILRFGRVKCDAETVSGEANLRQFFAKIRLQGHAYFPGLGSPDWTGLAVPIFNRSKQIVASLSILYRTGGSNSPMADFKPLVRTANAISAALSKGLEAERR